MIGKLNQSILVVLLSMFTSVAAADSNSHTHINHLMKSWPQAPKSLGLLPMALKEAAIVSLYIKLSRIHDQDLDWIKLHIKKAKHALKVDKMDEGALDYGLVKTAYAIAKETKLAASNDASINVKLHSKTIIMSAYNIASIAKKMERICRKVESATSIAQALSYVDELELLSSTLLDGVDLDKDGKITAFNNEGGLTLVKDKLTFMARTEGIIKVKRN